MGLFELPNGREVLEILFQREFATEWMDTYAIGIPQPTLNFAPGDTIRASKMGTCGAPVTWGYTHQGIMTAGHIAQKIGTLVKDKYHNPIGYVVGTWHPTKGQTGADVALIEASKSLFPKKVFNGPVEITSNKRDIELHLGSGKKPAYISGKMDWFYFTKNIGAHREVYLTDKGLTRGGDSGSAATLGGTNKLIGHLIGAAKDWTSIIQDAKYQFSVISSGSMFTNISL